MYVCYIYYTLYYYYISLYECTLKHRSRFDDNEHIDRSGPQAFAAANGFSCASALDLSRTYSLPRRGYRGKIKSNYCQTKNKEKKQLYTRNN